MATVRATSPESPIPGAPGFVSRNVTWAEYLATLEIVGDRPIRVTYDQGTMETFMPSFLHEDEAYRIGRIVDTLTEELDLPVKAGRTTTQKREDLDRGAEPDQCYWFGENARTMSGKRVLDLTLDPPPDLAAEVDVSRNSLDRLAIFAAIAIREIWRIRDGSLQFLHLDPDGVYQVKETSIAFPSLSRAEVQGFLELGRTGEDTGWVRSFRAFVRDVLSHRP